MNDLDYIIHDLEQEHPTVIALLREFLPRFISMVKGLRREQIRNALDAAHAHITQSRHAANEIARQRIADAGEGDG